MSKVVVIGSTNVDMVMNVERLPRPGETIGDGAFQIFYGGKGANQAVAAARAGADVSFISRLGDDVFAAGLRDSLNADGIDTSYVNSVAGVATGTAVILVDAAGENSIGVAPGANGTLTEDQLDAALALLQRAGTVLLQFEVPLSTVKRCIYEVSKLGKRLVVNPAPAHELPLEDLALIDILVLNETEAEVLMGGKQVGDYAEVADYFQAHGVETVILTLGTKGAYLATADERVHVPAFKVDAVDTTAAGDVFCGALAAALEDGLLIKEAVRFAAAAAAIAVTRHGAQPSAPKRAEIMALLEA